MIESLAAAQLTRNMSLAVVEMANVQLSDAAALVWAEVVKSNPRIRSLNLEGNLIGSVGISAIAAAIAESGTLVELMIDHQVSERWKTRCLAPRFSLPDV